jgi:hypothetical protein
MLEHVILHNLQISIPLKLIGQCGQVTNIYHERPIVFIVEFRGLMVPMKTTEIDIQPHGNR